MKKLWCILIPLHNEELLLPVTLKSFRNAGVAWEDMYFVDDGSTDKTIEILTKATFPYLSMYNVLSLNPNVGKTEALITAFKYFNLADRYEWLGTCDGDTCLRTDYLKNLVPLLNDQPKSIAAVASRVCSIKESWNPFVSYRVYEYFITQQFYKRAQHHLNVITVLPGCGSTFRTEVFQKLSEKPDPSCITEDMLWTSRIHTEDLGKVLYSHNTVVITQDPSNFTGYKKQNVRWYSGGWQVWLKQEMWKIFSHKNNAETSFLFAEGVFFSALFVFALICFGLQIFPLFVHYFFWFDSLIFTILGIIAAIFELDFKLILYMPFFYLMRIAKCIIFLYSFISIVIFKVDKRKKLQWNQVERY